jgi:hypothetical protein
MTDGSSVTRSSSSSLSTEDDVKYKPREKSKSSVGLPHRRKCANSIPQQRLKPSKTRTKSYSLQSTNRNLKEQKFKGTGVHSESKSTRKMKPRKQVKRKLKRSDSHKAKENYPLE